MNIISNDEVIEYSEEFKLKYLSAKVRNSEVLLAKAAILLPLFVSNTKTPTDMLLKPFKLSAKDLIGTGYSDFEMTGLRMNAEQHLDFWLYLNALSQKMGVSKIIVSVKEMLPVLKIASKDFPTYSAYFEEFLERIKFTRVKYTVNSRLVTVDSPLLGKFEKIGDGIWSINLGSFMIDSLLNDTYTSKILISKPKCISGGNARLVYLKLNLLVFKDSAEISMDTLFNVLGLISNSKADRDANFKTLNKAIFNLTDLGFIASCVDVKSGRSITGKLFHINKKFNADMLNELVDSENEPVFSFKAGKEVVATTDVELVTTDGQFVGFDPELKERLANIGKMLPTGEWHGNLYLGDVVQDPWESIPDFEAWLAADKIQHRSTKDCCPRKEIEDEYSRFYD